MTDETLFTTKEKQFLYSKLYKFKEITHMSLMYGATDSVEYGIIRPTFRL